MIACGSHPERWFTERAEQNGRMFNLHRPLMKHESLAFSVLEFSDRIVTDTDSLGFHPYA